MPTGFQDWDVPVNINAQDLGEIINRPKYGTPAVSSVDTSTSFDGLKQFVSISGKGMIYGGFVVMDGDQDQSTSILQLTVDTIPIFDDAISDILSWGVSLPLLGHAFLLKYDSVNFIYSFGLGKWITFESSFKVVINRQGGGNTNFHSRIVYALI